jgi:hypothetical protein
MSEPQVKPARRLNYRERFLAGQIERKPRKRLNAVAKKHVAKRKQYVEWIKIAMYGVARCDKCKAHVSTCGSLEPHHPSGRHGVHLFEVTPVCRLCHAYIHQHPDTAFAEGWLTPSYRGTLPIKGLPQPFTLLPYP